mgnify:CR=1 FL=1
MTEQIEFNVEDAELPIEYGPFKIIEGEAGADFMLVDDAAETVPLPFDAEEAADLEFAVDKLLRQIEEVVDDGA